MAPSDRAPDAATESEPGPGLGDRLRRARESHGLTLDEVASELRIAAPALAALEACRFDELGAPVFAKGYLKQYGARLGLNVSELASEYDRLGGARSIEIAPTRKIRLRDERQIMLWILAVLLLVLAGGGLAWWWLGQGGSVGVPGLDSGRGQPAVIDGSTEESPGEVLATPAEPVPPPATPVPAAGVTTPVSADSDAAPDPSPDRGAASPPDAVNAAGASASLDDAAPAQAASGPQLEIYFTADSWTEITDSDGNRLYYNLGRAGTRAQVPADRRLRFLIGNATGVELRFNGRQVPIPASRRSDNVAQFVLDALTE